MLCHIIAVGACNDMVSCHKSLYSLKPFSGQTSFSMGKRKKQGSRFTQVLPRFFQHVQRNPEASSEIREDVRICFMSRYLRAASHRASAVFQYHRGSYYYFIIAVPESSAGDPDDIDKPANAEQSEC